MLKEVKKDLIDKPNLICNILKSFGFHSVTLRTNEIRCGRCETGNRNSISIRLINNENLFVNDYAHAVSMDLISYIINEKKATFKDVMQVIKNELKIDNYYIYEQKKEIFGGFFANIKQKTISLNNVIPEHILNRYCKLASKRFLNDNISISSQMKFGICYDPASQRIVIPIRDIYGQLVGVKGRCNSEVSEYDSKYIYIEPCMVSSTLYGYSENYGSLSNRIVVGESEKCVMQADTMGYNNFLAIGSSSISEYQAKCLVSLMPKEIVFMFDKGLSLEIIKKNIDVVKKYSKHFSISLAYWNSEQEDIPDKANLCDLGRERLEQGLKTELIYDL